MRERRGQESSWLAFLAVLFLNYWGELMSYVQLQLFRPSSDCWAGPVLPSWIYDFDPKDSPPSSVWGWLTTTEPWAERSQITLALPVSQPSGKSNGAKEIRTVPSWHPSQHTRFQTRSHIPTRYFIYGSPCLISQILSLLLPYPCSREVQLAVWGVGLKEQQLETKSHRTAKYKPGKKSKIR